MCCPSFLVCASFVATVALSAGSTTADAGGMFVGENGGQSLARAGAFVVKADDPTALANNPAGLAKTRGTLVYLGVNVVNQTNQFQREGAYEEQLVLPIFGEQPDYVGDPYPLVANENPTSPVPMIALSFRVARLAVGFGVFAPHAPSGRAFSDSVTTASSDNAPGPQRYDALSQTGVAAFPSLALAYDFGRLRLGVRAAYGFSRIETERVQQFIGNDGESPIFDVKARLKAKDNSVFMWGAGAQLELTRWLEVGAAYASAMVVNAVGTAELEFSDLITSLPINIAVEPVPDAMAKCAPGGEVGAIKACFDIVLPAAANLGIRVVQRNDDGVEVGDIEFDVRWEDWSTASEQRAVIDGQDSLTGTPLGETVLETGFHDSLALRLGGSKAAITDWGRLEFRGGVAYDGPSKPVQWAVIANDGAARWTASSGLAVAKGRFRVDLGGAFTLSDTITVSDALVPESGGAGQPSTNAPLGRSHVFNAGTYYNRYWILSLGLQAGW